MQFLNNEEKAMEKKEIPFGTYLTLLAIFVAIPGLIIWKVLWPVLTIHNPSHFYHRGAACQENEYFFWSGVIVLVSVFGVLIWKLVAECTPKSESSWAQIMEKVVDDFSISLNPFTIPFLVSLGLFFTGVILTFLSGRPTWTSLLFGSVGLFSLVICSWLDNRRKKKIRNGNPFRLSLVLLVIGIVLMFISGRFSWLPFLIGSMGFSGIMACLWDVWSYRR